ncbi:hypothetical protein F0562_007874 [Nyssa sinensis]|uniref:Protein kinase domain-containing protein n=1 Tax=Nyssa sinensis TaxID=561372 RepID=A0A5J5A880_9ASTE|nr:hypothetical protein F0562_007874 [Nyssa sinensis]
MHDSSPSVLETNLRVFSFKELNEATGGFNDELGRGSSGIVYKGTLKFGSRNLVAVKKLDRNSVEMVSGDEEKGILIDWVFDCYMEGNLEALTVENDDVGMCDIATLQRWVMIAIWCLQEDPSKRPTMKTVTQKLEGWDEVPIPLDASSI